MAWATSEPASTPNASPHLRTLFSARPPQWPQRRKGIWDRMFGTYEPEDAPVTYGPTGGVRVRTPGDALIGGYRELANDLRPLSSRAAVRHLMARP